jgi:glycosyltransferase involved in cell wall biosynthesis
MQTVSDWELVIVNNHSSDNTADIIASFRDHRIQHVLFRNNGIIAASRNEDSDADGFSNMKEFQDNTNPRDPDSVPQPPVLAHAPLTNPVGTPAPWPRLFEAVPALGLALLVFWKTRSFAVVWPPYAYVGYLLLDLLLLPQRVEYLVQVHLYPLLRVQVVVQWHLDLKSPI